MLALPLSPTYLTLEQLIVTFSFYLPKKGRAVFSPKRDAHGVEFCRYMLGVG